MIGGALSEGLSHTDLAVLECYADPRALLAAGPARLTRLITITSRGQLGAAKAQALRTAAAKAVVLWEGDSAAALDDLAAEVASEVRLVRAAEAERARPEHARDAAFAQVDPAGLAASLPGLGPVGTTQLVATMGRPGRFPNGGAFKAFTGLTPRANETGQTDRKHQPMTRPALACCSQLVQSANTTRKLDPQLAAVYHAQMTQRGATHRKALCVVAARLAERGWLTLARGEPYVVCDLEGRPVTPEQARRLIAERFTVTPEVRRRRRSTKQAGKALTRRSRRKPSHSAKLDTRRPSPPPAWTPHPSSSTTATRPFDTTASLGNQPLRRPAAQPGLAHHRVARLRDDPQTRAYAARRRSEGKSAREVRRCLSEWSPGSCSSCWSATIVRRSRSSRRRDAGALHLRMQVLAEQADPAIPTSWEVAGCGDGATCRVPIGTRRTSRGRLPLGRASAARDELPLP